MDLTEDFAIDEVQRLGRIAGDIGRGRPVKPDYSGVVAFSAADTGAEVTDTVLDDAVRELAMTRNESYSDTWTQVRLLAGGEKDTASLTAATVQLSHCPASEKITLTDVSAEDRRQYAKKGWALPDGSYPIPDKAHLASAARLAASGHGDVKAARALIKRRARELGVDLSTLPGFSGSDKDDTDSNKVKTSAAQHARLRRAGLSDADIVTLAAGKVPADPADEDTSDEGGVVDKIIARNRGAGYFEHHVSRDGDPTDKSAPSKGGVTHPAVQRYLAMLNR